MTDLEHSVRLLPRLVEPQRGCSVSTKSFVFCAWLFYSVAAFPKVAYIHLQLSCGGEGGNGGSETWGEDGEWDEMKSCRRWAQNDVKPALTSD